MNFIDKVEVVVKAGDGGNGAVSFRRERFVSHGGPDGGDGGDGGDVVVKATNNENTLANFRHEPRILATNGQAGSKKRKHGKAGQDKLVNLPIGTVIVDETNKVLADLTHDEQVAIIAMGGQGGFGNAHFVSSTRQAPKFAEVGEKTEELKLTLELKMIADVGLVGLPNAGKSTLLATISNAKPAIADYPFTTIIPNLGVVDINSDNSILVADIPGLIEGASLGKGLGDQFLRHIERTKVLVHLIDIYGDDIAHDYAVIEDELKNYKVDLSKKPQLILLTKIDGVAPDLVEQKLAQIKTVAKKGSTIMAVSAKSKLGVQVFLNELLDLVLKQRQRQLVVDERKSKRPILKLDDETVPNKISKTKSGFMVTGTQIEKFAAKTDFSNQQSVQRLRVIMQKQGLLRELIKKHVKDDDMIQIGKFGSFNF